MAHFAVSSIPVRFSVGFDWVRSHACCAVRPDTAVGADATDFLLDCSRHSTASRAAADGEFWGIVGISRAVWDIAAPVTLSGFAHLVHHAASAHPSKPDGGLSARITWMPDTPTYDRAGGLAGRACKVSSAKNICLH
jgi:hypothetical protein